ncbi:hybrid sensor histidine kinase/response regulator [Lujinxingia litoralis]|uniref:histidine kinase n=1 Tax=Lujinxingia litoralis TaxID=2211119 RepID=A0A328C1P2_9DELT|nr:response regulator [Lujinxingia litoralis]RAL20539.1 hybrid sensor histidine kinase/response regulator [Lujinxingia litoralis]
MSSTHPAADVGLLDALLARIAPNFASASPEQAFRAKIVIVFSLALAIWAPVYSVIMYALSSTWFSGVGVMICAGTVCASIAMLRRGVSFHFIGNWLAFNVYWCMLFVTMVAGFGSPPLLWLSVVPMLAILVANIRSGVVWLVLSLTASAIYYINVLAGAERSTSLGERESIIFEMTVLAGLYVLVLSMTLAYEALKNWAITQMQRREAHTRAIVETAADGILTLTLNGQIEDLNPAAARIFGYSQGAIVSSPFSAIVPAISGRPPELSALQQDISTEEELAERQTLFSDDDPVGLPAWEGALYESDAVRADGERFPVELSVSPIENDVDERRVVILRDITARRQAEIELREARDAALQASEAKSAFLANTSHELRTPLNAIIGYSELISEEMALEGQDEYLDDLQKIGSAANHLLSLINGILDLAKIEAGKMDMYLETINLPDLIQNVQATITPLVEKNGNRFSVDAQLAPAAMVVDHTKLRQILFNLLSNAAKFTHKSVVRLQIYSESLDHRDWCVFEVQDRGIGIPQEKLEKLFDAFTQADESTTRKFGGTGLGLTITRHFTEMMGGTISATSTLGEGSTFRVRLPLKVEQAVNDPLELDEALDLPGPRLPADAPSVLIIDDDPTVHALMRRFLNREGYRVNSALSGSEGLEMARELQPHVITLDVMMPEMDGWTVLTRLKADPEVSQIPVVMLTIVSNKSMGYALGASEYLLKPVDRARLTNVLETFGQGRAHERSLMIVEDDDATRDVLERTVIQAGWSVNSAPNGRVAMELLQEGMMPGLILLDLMMPEMDGFEVLDRLQENPDWRDIPVVVVTAMDLNERERAKLTKRVHHVLNKGQYSRDELLALVRDAVHRGTRAPSVRTLTPSTESA